VAPAPVSVTALPESRAIAAPPPAPDAPPSPLPHAARVTSIAIPAIRVVVVILFVLLIESSSAPEGARRPS